MDGFVFSSQSCLADLLKMFLTKHENMTYHKEDLFLIKK